jgi:hypothetical protein
MPAVDHAVPDGDGADASDGLSAGPSPELDTGAGGGSVCGATEKGRSAGSGGGSDCVPVKLRVVSVDPVNDLVNDSRDSISRGADSSGIGCLQ